MQFTKEMLHNIYVIKKATAAMWEPTMERHGLTRAEIDVIAFLANNPDRNAAHEIVEYRQIAKSHVSKAVESLLGRGLLTATKDGNDRRCVHLTLTEECGDIVHEIKQKQREYSQKLTEGLSEQELETLLSLTSRIAANLAE